MNKYSLNTFLIKFFTYPLRYLPFRLIHFIGNFLGIAAYYLFPRLRKRTLSNLSLAKSLQLSKKELITTAIASLQNLAISFLEYAKFDHIKDTSRVITCENPETAHSLIAEKKGIVFFCAHQANWEVLFLDGTQKMPGIAIGRPIKNASLYKWIQSIREKFGGTIIPPKSALKEGLRALRKGKFIGIIGDQGMPESSYSFDFFGRRCFTTPIPAVLAYRTNCPMMVASTRREKGKYTIHYSDPIFPNLANTMEEEIYRMMKIALNLQENSIRKNPKQWLWLHNRWKQETPANVYYRYRHESILLILPNAKDAYETIKPHMQTLRKIYPKAFISALIHKRNLDDFPLDDVELIPYTTIKESYISDFRFKFVLNFTNIRSYKSHFLKQSAFKVLCEQDLLQAAREHLRPGDSSNLSTLLLKALCRPNIFSEKNAI
ncbi:MAG: hypothetical protein KAR79_00630 [Simkaniaceae bacterium]|nr:hypothetical protein [Simkaniaceae bacterium]